MNSGRFSTVYEMPLLKKRISMKRRAFRSCKETAENNGCSSTSTTKTYTIRIIRDIPPDTEKPALIQPLDMVVEGNTLGCANVEFSVRATDIRDGFLQPISENPEPICVTLPHEASGSFEWDGYILKCNAYFPLRKEPYTIVCKARDRAGNTVSGSFKITVVDTTPPEISGIAEFIEMEATGYYSAATIPEGIIAWT